MKQTLCLYFQVHQPFRLRRYRFFDIGKDHSYYDEFSNRTIMRKVAERCYLPANKLMLELIKQYGKSFRIAYSISGVAIEQLERYAPDVLDSFKALAKTGCVEFLGETYAHSIAVLKNVAEFEQQVKEHGSLIQKHFGQKPTTFRNTELIYSDDIGAKVADMGFSAMLTEGAKHVLGWKSPNYLYANATNPRLKILLRNFRLSDDIAFRFSDRGWSEWPLTTDKYTAWLNAVDKKEEVVNLFMDYETFGEHQWAVSGIFEFLRYLPGKILAHTNFEFLTPSETAKKHQPVAPIKVAHPISWADEERDLTAWLGNELQNEAFSKVYALSDAVMSSGNAALIKDWRMLQNSDHFYYMSTKWFSDGDVHKYFNPYDTPYDAFINYMNVLSDFSLRVKSEAKDTAPAPARKAAAEDRKTTDAPAKSVVAEKVTAKEGNVAAPSLNINSKAATKKTVPIMATTKKTAAKKPAAKKAAPAAAKKVVKKAAPAKKAAAKKVVKKAAPAKKAAAKKVVKKAAPAKKAAAKKVVKKAAPAKKAAAKKVVKKAAPAKKVAAKKPAAKKVVKKAAPAKKVAAKKPAAKKVVAKKPSTFAPTPAPATSIFPMF